MNDTRTWFAKFEPEDLYRYRLIVDRGDIVVSVQELDDDSNSVAQSDRDARRTSVACPSSLLGRMTTIINRKPWELWATGPGSKESRSFGVENIFGPQSKKRRKLTTARQIGRRRRRD